MWVKNPAVVSYRNKRDITQKQVLSDFILYHPEIFMYYKRVKFYEWRSQELTGDLVYQFPVL